MRFDQRWMARLDGDPIHNPYDNGGTVWTTVNAGEVFPGVPTPLTWSICGASFEIATRRGCAAIGALPSGEVPIPADVDERFFNIWFGRAALNVSLLGRVANSMPGSSSDSLEQAYFGGALAETSSTAIRSRYPVVAGKMPAAAVKARHSMRDLETDAHAWWRRTVRGLPDDTDALVRLLEQAYERMAEITTQHVVNTMIGQGVFDAMRGIARRANVPELAATAVTGGESPETRVVSELWEVSRGERDLADFVAVHGFHGPGESELSSRSWREDTAPLDRLLATYRTADEDSSPVALQRRKTDASRAARDRIASSSSRLVRTGLPALISAARTYMGLREVGRCALLRTVDVTRAAARALGEGLERSGVLADPADVFYLTTDELANPPADTADLVTARRAARERYRGLEIPSRFSGPIDATAPADEGEVTSLSGVAASAGTVEGPARVMLEADDDDLEFGEILVCRTTDPGWASYFQVAAGAVVEIGGQMSHGAIVAREVGIPCVINAAGATRALHTGDVIRVNGDSGEVTVLERSEASAAAKDDATAGRAE
jgi:pyruvate,water dikinase